MRRSGRSFIHLLRYLVHLDPPDSQTTPLERSMLSRYADGCGRALEIGVYEGMNTRLLAESIDARGVLYAVDPFFHGRVPICWSEIIARRQVGRSVAAKRVRFVKALSWEAFDLIEGTFDFLFIDGDHSLDGITRDWMDWAGRVEPGGIVALHDTRVPAHNPAVRALGSHRYFESHIRHDHRFELIDQADSLSVMRRRRDDVA